MMKRFSQKQRRVLSWWRAKTSSHDYDAIICDGAVRSGKTLCTALSFFCWAMCCFEEKNFALCGKTIAAAKRNVWNEVRPLLEELGISCQEQLSKNLIELRFGRRRNTVYLFGGRDESSAGHVQGMTLAGALLDEVALMPRSFVEQVCARCSVQGSRLWFSCNPESPGHWFYQEWILRAEEKRALRIHFTMGDNPGLSEQVIRKYQAMFQGSFYRRFVLGEWVGAEGLVYDFFDGSYIQKVPRGNYAQWYVSCDYGTVNPTSMGLWGRREDVWYRVKEYYFNPRLENRQKTDSEYAAQLKKLAGARPIAAVVVDPSAASFIETLRREGYRVIKAQNQVLTGIRITARLLKEKKLVICAGCDDAIREFGLYRWREKDAGTDQVRKQDDHAMDDIRYFAATVAAGDKQVGFAAGRVERGRF